MANKKKSSLNPEKIDMLDYKVFRQLITTPEGFEENDVIGYGHETDLQLSFNYEEKLIWTEFNIKIQTESNEDNSKEAEAEFVISFVYHIDNLEELSTLDKHEDLVLDEVLESVIYSISYSTLRGLLMGLLQHSGLSKFILPTVDISEVMTNKK